MSTHSTASTHEETPHATNSITNKPISEALKRRAQSLIKDKSIDASGRTWIRYALEINDPALSELVRRADAGEPIIDDSHLLEANEQISDEDKLERLAEMISASCLSFSSSAISSLASSRCESSMIGSPASARRTSSGSAGSFISNA